MSEPFRHPPIIDQPTAANPEPGFFTRIKNAVVYFVIMVLGSAIGLLAGLFGSIFAALFTIFAGLLLGSAAGRQIARAIVLKQRPEFQVVWTQARRWRYGEPPGDQR